MGTNRWVWLWVALAAIGIGASARAAQDNGLATDAGAGYSEGLDLGGPRTAQSPQPRVGDDWQSQPELLAHVQKIVAACYSVCHRQDGLSKTPSAPNISGQKPAYIRKQLETFNKNNAVADSVEAHLWQSWERSNVLMNSVTIKVNAQMYPYIADLIGQKPCDGEKPKATPSPPAVVQPTAVKDCVACHGSDGQGTAANVPILAGQSYDYLLHQLILIRDSGRHEPRDRMVGWRTHPIMEAYVTRLTILDLRAVARYYADLPCRGVASAPAH